MLKLDAADYMDVAMVAAHMRERDVVEFLATSTAVDRADLALHLTRRYGQSDELIAARFNGEAVAIGGCIQHRPNVVTLLFFATDAFPHIALGLTRFITKRLFPEVKAAGAHRIECVSHAEHRDAHRWIRMLGLRQEAELRGFGRHGETFLQFAWVRDAG